MASEIIDDQNFAQKSKNKQKKITTKFLVTTIRLTKKKTVAININ